MSEITVTKKSVVEFTKAKLASDDKWAIRALEVVFENQTAAEQSMAVTVESNGKGFTGPDAEFLTSLANQWRKFGRLSMAQMSALHKTMPKYHAQVIEASKRNGKYDQLVGMVAALQIPA